MLKMFDARSFRILKQFLMYAVRSQVPASREAAEVSIKLDIAVRLSIGCLTIGNRTVSHSSTLKPIPEEGDSPDTSYWLPTEEEHQPNLGIQILTKYIYCGWCNRKRTPGPPTTRETVQASSHQRTQEVPQPPATPPHLCQEVPRRPALLENTLNYFCNLMGHPGCRQRRTHTSRHIILQQDEKERSKVFLDWTKWQKNLEDPLFQT